MTVQSVAVAGLQTVVNHLLELDPELAEGLAELEGSVLEVHVQGIDKRFQLHPSATGVVENPPRTSALVADLSGLWTHGPWMLVMIFSAQIVFWSFLAGTPGMLQNTTGSSLPCLHN